MAEPIADIHSGDEGSRRRCSRDQVIPAGSVHVSETGIIDAGYSISDSTSPCHGIHRPLNQASTPRILPHVIPLLPIALARTQHMIEELFLQTVPNKFSSRPIRYWPLLPCPHEGWQRYVTQLGDKKNARVRYGHSGRVAALSIMRVPPFVDQDTGNFV